MDVSQTIKDAVTRILTRETAMAIAKAILFLSAKFFMGLALMVLSVIFPGAIL